VSDSTVYIYGLCDPRTDEVRYIGKTKHSPAFRLRGHIAAAKSGHKRHTTYWINELLSIGLRPNIYVIERVDGEIWDRAERYWIAYFRSLGCNLTNHGDGGEGGHNSSPEKRAQLSARLRGRPCSPETRAKISAAQIGKIIPPEQREKISRAGKGKTPPNKGKIMSDEFRQKMSGIVKGRRSAMNGKRHTPESIAKTAESKSHYYLITSPDGQETKIKGLIQFCKENGIPLNRMYDCAAGTRSDWHGWKAKRADVRSTETPVYIPPPPQPRFRYRAISSTGEEIITDSLRNFCAVHNLSNGSVYLMLAGKRNHVKGWVISKIED